MSKLSSDDKFKRVMKFLVASTEPPIAQLLVQRGFSEEDRKEGWALLDAATGRHLAVPEASGTFQTQYNTVLDQLDDWENIWFDVADAALTRKAKEVHSRLFQNLSKVSGSEVLLTVKSFIGRIREMQATTDDETQAAVALLAKRGLDDACLAEAESLIARIETEQPPTAPTEDTEALKAAREQAGKEMWAWFLDWSKTARTVVKNRNYHVMLGLISHHGASKSDGASAPEDDDIIDDEPDELSA